MISPGLTPLHWLDYAIILVYFAAVLRLGFLLQRQTRTSEETAGVDA